jgi:hypothetical protein
MTQFRKKLHEKSYRILFMSRMLEDIEKRLSVHSIKINNEEFIKLNISDGIFGSILAILLVSFFYSYKTVQPDIFKLNLLPFVEKFQQLSENLKRSLSNVDDVINRTGIIHHFDIEYMKGIQMIIKQHLDHSFARLYQIPYWNIKSHPKYREYNQIKNSLSKELINVFQSHTIRISTQKYDGQSFILAFHRLFYPYSGSVYKEPFLKKEMLYNQRRKNPIEGFVFQTSLDKDCQVILSKSQYKKFKNRQHPLFWEIAYLFHLILHINKTRITHLKPIEFFKPPSTKPNFRSRFRKLFMYPLPKPDITYEQLKRAGISDQQIEANRRLVRRPRWRASEDITYEQLKRAGISDQQIEANRRLVRRPRWSPSEDITYEQLKRAGISDEQIEANRRLGREPRRRPIDDIIYEQSRRWIPSEDITYEQLKHAGISDKQIEANRRGDPFMTGW